MAISPKNLYPSRVIDGDGAYPYGKALNVQNGVEGTGTPLEAEWLNDIWGSQQALLAEAGIAPNGQPDSVGNSQYLDALKKIQSDKSRESITAVYKAQGYNNVFFFEDGFTYSEANDVGVYLDGTAWTYADAGALPVTIAAGTVPSVGAGYEQVTFNSASGIGDASGGSVQDFIDASKAQGIMMWDTDTTYPVNGLAKGSNGQIYTAISEQLGNDPVSDDGTNWILTTDIKVRTFGPIDTPSNLSSTIVACVLFANIHGISTVDFGGIDSEVDFMDFSNIENVDFFGNGAKLRKVSPATSDIFRFKQGCKNIDVYGFDDLDGDFDSNNVSTGGNPVIAIGDTSGNGGGGLTNENIRVFYNGIRRSNWAGVVVYGRSNSAETLTPLNKNISVFHNEITDCGGNGIFVYKNCRTFRAYGNLIGGMAADGIIFDTMAESDTVPTEVIVDAHAYDNTIENFGKVMFGVGVLVKGAVSQFSVKSNVIKSSQVQAAPALTNYGVLVTRDFDLSEAYNGDITLNEISNINGSSGGVGVAVLQVNNIQILNNNVFGTQSENYQVGTSSQNIKMIGNHGENAGVGKYGFSLLGINGGEIERLQLIGNTYEKGAGTSLGGFNLSYVKDGYSYGNLAPDFTSTAFVVANQVEFMYQSEQKSTGIPVAGKLHLGGDLQWEKTPSLSNPVACRVCVAAGDPGVWRPVQWVVGRGTTASRPTLGSQDIGVTYLDNDLAPNGKPITWNGLVWVDSMGVSV